MSSSLLQDRSKFIPSMLENLYTLDDDQLLLISKYRREPRVEILPDLIDMSSKVIQIHSYSLREQKYILRTQFMNNFDGTNTNTRKIYTKDYIICFYRLKPLFAIRSKDRIIVDISIDKDLINDPRVIFENYKDNIFIVLQSNIITFLQMTEDNKLITLKRLDNEDFSNVVTSLSVVGDYLIINEGKIFKINEDLTITMKIDIQADVSYHKLSNNTIIMTNQHSLYIISTNDLNKRYKCREGLEVKNNRYYLSIIDSHNFTFGGLLFASVDGLNFEMKDKSYNTKKLSENLYIHNGIYLVRNIKGDQKIQILDSTNLGVIENSNLVDELLFIFDNVPIPVNIKKIILNLCKANIDRK